MITPRDESAPGPHTFQRWAATLISQPPGLGNAITGPRIPTIGMERRQLIVATIDFDVDEQTSIRRQGVQQMWKKQDDAQRDFASIGDAQAESLLAESLRNEDSHKRNFAVVSKDVPTEHSERPSPSPTMQKYTDAIKEFTQNATAFMEQLPLLTRARGAYEEAMRVSAEMRQVLNAHDENLRTLMAELERKVNLQDLKSAADKKPPEPAKVENLQETDEGKGRIRWP